MSKRIVIIGAGPTGIGAGYRLNELKYKNWKIYEMNNYVGGLSTTYTDNKGFLWDIGGHVIHSHYKYFDDFLLKALKNEYNLHQRISWIKTKKTLVPYPFQNNIKYLPINQQWECIKGLLDINNINQKNKLSNFENWILKTFGSGIANIFMFPYNKKVWATPLKLMSSGWISERISVVDVKNVLKNIIFNKDDVSWGPNNKFFFPKNGGTGEIFLKGSQSFINNIVFNKEVIKIDHNKKIIYFSDNTVEKYDYLINTMPLDKLIKILKNVPSNLKKESKKLVYNSGYIIGIGLNKKINTDKCWMYFANEKVPFYRLTYFHNYSINNVPNKKYSSLMLEVSFSKYKKINKTKLIDLCINSLVENKIINKSDKSRIISKKIYKVPYSYPVPTIQRNKALKYIQKELFKFNIYSRGRFGAWRYELGNMDHCFMQGVEAVDNILKNKKEKILFNN